MADDNVDLIAWLRSKGPGADKSQAAADALEAKDRRIAELDEGKGQAYLERNHLVAALARMFPSGILRTNIPGWSDDWHGCVYIDLPTGQVSYHYHDSQAHLFADLPPYESDWDGHDKDTVHARLRLLGRGQRPPPDPIAAAEETEMFEAQGKIDAAMRKRGGLEE